MIHKNWQELIKPAQLEVRPGAEPSRRATVVAEPLERGFGLTLGNALRRVLLSSLQGAAITSVQIDNVLHEFSSVPGVREDVTDIVLNLKGVSLKMEVDGPKRLTVQARGPMVVTAGDISESSGIAVLNRDHVICHLDDGAELFMELTVNVGKGYVSADRNKPEDAPIGLIPIDAIYSPVKRVSYEVQPTREGQVLDYDRPDDEGRDRRVGDARRRGGLRRADPAGPAPDLRQLRRTRIRTPRRRRRRPGVQSAPTEEGRRAGVVGPGRRTA